MDRLVVACVQQRMHLPHSLDDYREDVRRFLRVAAAKQARLVIFPELGGVMVAPPILDDFRSSLLKRADRGRRRDASLWQRTTGSLAGSLATLLQADFRRALAALLDVGAQEVWGRYVEVYSALAREFGMVLVAPSAYLPDPRDGVVRNMACVFSANGDLLGHQAKVVLHPADVDLAQPGSTWDVIQTEVGRLGLILGSDVLYPEVGRVLAYQGADVLVCQAACTDVLLYNKIRAGSLARMQDNQLYAAASFLVGDNRLSRAQRTPFVGKSAIFAPQELTPRANGVLVEMGNQRSEGVLAAPWDFPALKELWETSETPVRRQIPLAQAGQALAQLYARLQALPRVLEPTQLALDTSRKPDSAAAEEKSAAVVGLEELSVVSSITNRWPLWNGSYAAGEGMAVEELEEDAFLFDFDEAAPPPRRSETATYAELRGEDETDEMDIVTKSGNAEE
ncbi:MAG: hypothetical protein IT329_16865 [Caldilineaceae bacterium]|nr:hypothetical protein [Caldilineaceae bacterium]